MSVDTPRPGGDDDLPEGFSVPDDLSSLAGLGDAPGADAPVSDASASAAAAAQEEQPQVALVVTQVAGAEALAAACALAKVEADAIFTPVGAVAVLRDPSAGPAGAGALSAMLKAAPVVLLVRRAGRISATHWVNGVQGDELPPGLVLSDAPPELEQLLLGTLTIADAENAVTSVGISRWKAMRLLAAAAKDTRRR
ncbi:hypothetical protein QUV83_17420 [Cellulomonas cellasea]|uniref:hypothetical protein n=1 Tax=Cellulomonas cellasea TaxID=43670 RepID=UPI0025A4105B|nr:hypothetical protein [Cellulomonas cellasea]MDM8086557.1 hypothetical protein [Cellulomonas cellasea]